METCKVDNQGRVVLPAKWRESAGVKPGTELLLSEQDGQLILKTRLQAVREAQEMVRKWAKPGVSMVEELLRERRREVEREDEEARERAQLRESTPR